MLEKRSSGILAHITSIPSPYGIGDIGTSAHEFLTFLNRSDQTYWQFLPISPTNQIFDHSPYMSSSAFAGNSLMLCPDLMLSGDLISKEIIENIPKFNPYSTQFTEVIEFKQRLVLEAYTRFDPKGQDAYQHFVETTPWLQDYAMFMVAKEVLGDCMWSEWPRDFARRRPAAIQAFLKSHSEKLSFYCFEQYLFFKQWDQLREKAQENNVELFGDLPIYVSYDSVDVWANQDIFLLDQKTLQPTHVAGVPPDYFSETGQRWGNPLYNWQTESSTVRQNLYSWWSYRLEHLFNLVDMARIDHFRGFESYWAIPESEETAINGKWHLGPGYDFFKTMEKQLGKMNIVAEDLGIITKEVHALRDKLQYPGMKVLQFAFDGNPDNDFLPYNYKDSQCIVYTGTHDNDTTVGWFLSDKLTDTLRREIKTMANRELHDNSSIHKDLMYLAQSSISKLCIFPLQDVLGFGNDCKMNSPGVAGGNWRWRCAAEFLNDATIDFLKETTRRYNRNPTKTTKS